MGCGPLDQNFWTVPAYDAANFTASGAMTWTVTPASILTWAYARVGNIVTASFVISDTSVGGTLSNGLRIALPSGLTVARNAIAAIKLDDAAMPVMGYAYARLNQPYISVHKYDGSNFTAATNTTDVQGQITLEVF